MLDLIKLLRDETGAGMMDVKQALDDARGDADKAKEILRKRGSLKAAKKSARSTGEGFIGSYVHANGKLAALVALSCETDFVARTKDFQDLAHELAMQVAAASPLFVKPEEVPEEVVAKEKEFYREELKNAKKPEKMWEQIMKGKLDKYFSEVCLLKQVFIKDDKRHIEDLLIQATAKLGENIQVKRFERFTL